MPRKTERQREAGVHSETLRAIPRSRQTDTVGSAEDLDAHQSLSCHELEMTAKKNDQEFLERSSRSASSQSSNSLPDPSPRKR